MKKPLCALKHGLFQVLGAPVRCDYTWNIKCDSNFSMNAYSRWLVAFPERDQIEEWFAQHYDFFLLSPGMNLLLYKPDS